MPEQQFENHAKYYPPHHFIFYPVILVATIACVLLAGYEPAAAKEWIAIAVLFLCLGWLSFMLRQHYSLTNQNRVVRLELRLRFYILTGKRLETIEDKLSFQQLAALRFASDEELAGLIERTIQDNLSPTTIKKSIKSWLPDHMRV